MLIETEELAVERVSRIRRQHLVGGKGIKTIAREVGLSRNTVRKVLRPGEKRFPCEREEQPPPKLGGYKERVDALLLNRSVGLVGSPAAESGMRPIGVLIAVPAPKFAAQL